MQILIRDESASGAVTNELTLDLLDESVTVRDLIRSRIYQEIDDHNRRVREANATATPFSGLVTPSDSERVLNRGKTGVAIVREVDWHKQFAAACGAFEQNGFFILVDDRQAESLDESVLLKHDSRVSFVKLTPLVGG